MSLSKAVAALTLAASTLLSFPAGATVRDDFPSCYASLGASSPVQPDSPARELFVIVDQTLNPDKEIKRSVHRQVHSFLQPGDRITLIKFSAFIANNYTDVVLKGQLDRPLSTEARYDISKKLLKRFDACMKKQQVHVRKTIDQKLAVTFGREDMDIPKTELVGNLSGLGDSVVSRSNAPRKVVLLFSDMLENSDISSFYQSGSLKKIDADAEISKFRKEGLLSNWGDAEVFIIGAGLMPAKYAKAYRSENKMRPIRAFWEQYFKGSNAQLAGWGQPALLEQIR
ncbi:hypothetical protein J7438_20390 [Thalassotalea sp. G20_0]|uniref:hypothetical protein n=1 Tax=Thalassotalea sp. G20_0 TaxID=2821093 RepID=UPI001ADCD3EC|nr:hypothetical protein [Thalassotalea sp. G20_0]MBO9496421.1 hypothetical protein [Thalassotalea sp. G20_0]